MSFRAQVIVVAAIAAVPATAFSWSPWKKDGERKSPTPSPTGIPALSALLEPAGWEQTPELSSDFQVGSIFQIKGRAHVPWATDCIVCEINDSDYAALEMGLKLESGVIVDAGVGQGNAGAQMVRAISFASPTKRSAPRGSMQLSERCVDLLQAAGEQGEDLSKMYLVQDTLVAIIHGCQEWEAGAGVEVSPFGGGGLGASNSCQVYTNDPVVVGYRYQAVSELSLLRPRKCSSSSQEVKSLLEGMDEVHVRYQELAQEQVAENILLIDVYEMLVETQPGSLKTFSAVQEFTGIEDRVRIQEIFDKMHEISGMEEWFVGGWDVESEPGAEDAYRLMRSEVPSNLSGIRTAEVAYDAAFDAFLPIGAPTPVSEEGLDCDVRQWPFDTEFTELGFEPGGLPGVRSGDGIRGTYWVEVVEGGQDFIAHGLCDVDDDGVPAHYTVTKGSAVRRLTADNIY